MNIENTKKVFNLEERLYYFSKSVLFFSRKVSINLINRRLLDQLIRSSTSIGANFCEANEAESKKDKLTKIRISKKEAKETIYWLRLLRDLYPTNHEIQSLINESTELMKILATIYNKLK